MFEHRPALWLAAAAHRHLTQPARRLGQASRCCCPAGRRGPGVRIGLPRGAARCCSCALAGLGRRRRRRACGRRRGRPAKRERLRMESLVVARRAVDAAHLFSADAAERGVWLHAVPRPPPTSSSSKDARAPTTSAARGWRRSFAHLSFHRRRGLQSPPVSSQLSAFRVPPWELVGQEAEAPTQAIGLGRADAARAPRAAPRAHLLPGR